MKTVTPSWVAAAFSALGTPPRLIAPPWMLLTLFSAAATIAICYPAWPGYMSYDSLFAYEQGLFGIQTSLWPPVHAYMFRISHAVGADTWGVFLVQTFILLFGSGLFLHVIAASRRTAWILCAGFLVAQAYFPTLWGTLFAHWRDVPTVSFAALGLGLWAAAAQRRSGWLLATAVVSFCLSLSLRYNGFPLIIFVLAMMLWRPFLGVHRDAESAIRRRLAVGMVVGVLVAWASTQWRLPDLARLPKPHSWAGTQVFDVVGISACADHNYLPPKLTAGRAITPAQIRKAYDPRHMNITLAPKPGVPEFVRAPARAAVRETWRRLMVEETGCYLAHRTLVFQEQMGLMREGVFYPIHSGIDANPFGLELRHPALARAVTTYIARNADDLWRRPFLLYVAAAMLTLALLWARRPEALIAVAMLLGSASYLFVLFIAAPAADARYIFPPNIFCLLISLMAVGALVDQRVKGLSRDDG
ncbi:hypothetical protein [Caulobacter segnis]|uniref:hypothetical protein n=1 Tax=Caulobacter segnis TaxID=88688 RepID=UPI00285C6000|nr:hypothetical protein [Caulobacter segnis]MDR6627987.1 hypothetical protein [Caulobacter segnis]